MASTYAIYKRPSATLNTSFAINNMTVLRTGPTALTKRPDSLAPTRDQRCQKCQKMNRAIERIRTPDSLFKVLVNQKKIERMQHGLMLTAKNGRPSCQSILTNLTSKPRGRCRAFIQKRTIVKTSKPTCFGQYEVTPRKSLKEVHIPQVRTLQ